MRARHTFTAAIVGLRIGQAILLPDTWRPVAKGISLIIFHAGGTSGFIPGALLIFKSHLKTGDYHGDMNFLNYKKRLTEQLIPSLLPRSVLIIDNAPYHNVQINKPPTKNSTKAEMTEWLTINNVPFAENMLKVQLYDLINANKSPEKNVVIDNIMSEHGHSVLRLSPYHPDLNPTDHR